MDSKERDKNLDHVINAIATMDSETLEKVNIYIAGIESGKNLATKKCSLPPKPKTEPFPLNGKN